jgi:hypothetical protein
MEKLFHRPLGKSKELLSKSVLAFWKKYFDGMSEMDCCMETESLVAFTNIIQNGIMLNMQSKIHIKLTQNLLIFNERE